MPDKNQQAVRKARWLPALKEAVRLGTITNLDLFIEEQVKKFKPKNNKECRSLRDQLRGLIGNNMSTIAGGKMKVLPSLCRLVDSIEEQSGIRGLTRSERPKAQRPQPTPYKPIQPQPTAITQQESHMSPTASNLVEQTTRFHVKPIEAESILSLFFHQGGELKDEVTRGRSTLGETLWRAMQEGGYVKATGKTGSNTPSRVNKDRFRATLFLESDPERTVFKLSYKRPADLPKDERKMVARDQFAKDLTVISLLTAPPPPPVDDATSHKEDAPPANASSTEEGTLRSNLQAYIESQRTRAEEITEQIRKEEKILEELDEKRAKHAANHDRLIREEAEVQKHINDLSVFIK